MAYCRSCGKEIDETAAACSYCNAHQFVPAGSSERNIGKLIGMTLVWAAAFWVGSLFATGFALGLLNPEISEAEAEKIGEDVGGLYLIIALGASSGLTIAGQLPGTKK